MLFMTAMAISRRREQMMTVNFFMKICLPLSMFFVLSISALAITSDKEAQGENIQRTAATLAHTQRNHSPVLKRKRLPDAQEGQFYRQSIPVSDADGDRLSYRLSPNMLRQGPVIAANGQLLWQHGNHQLKLSRHGILSWQPDYAAAAKHNIEFIVNDGHVDTPMVIELIVQNVNRAPVFNVKAPLIAAENAPYAYPINIFDADGDKLALDLIAPPEGLHFRDNKLLWTPNFTQAGQHQISFAVADGEKRLRHSFIVDVANTNQKPEFVSTSVDSVNEGDEYHYQVGIRDRDQQATRLTVVQAPAGMVLENNALSWKTDHSSQGEYQVVLSASDGESDVQQRFTIKVVGVNQQPELANTAPVMAYESLPYQYQMQVNDRDGEALVYTLNNAPEGMTINQQGLIKWVPGYTQQGQHNIVISIDDGNELVDFDFVLTVINSNLAPAVEQIGDQALALGKTFKYMIKASDPDQDSLYYDLIYAPDSMSLSKAGIIRWLPQANDVGKHTIIIDVHDGDLKTRRHFELGVFR